MSYIMHFNPNHDKLGRFTFSKGGSVSEKKSPDSYKTSELDSKYKAYKDAKVSEFYERITKLPWVESDDDNSEEVWGKDVVKIADIGLEGLGWLNPGDIDDNSERSWFLFEDQTIGMPEIAYLASQGKSVKEIVDMINGVKDCEHQNYQFLEQYREEFHKNRKVYDEAEKKLPYPDAYYCGFTEYGRTDEKDEFINGCVEAAKKIEHTDSSASLTHFNPNHDPKTGQFTFSKEGYKALKGEYKSDIKSARKEFRKVVKDSGKNRLLKSKTDQLNAIDIVDKYAGEKASELYNKYVELRKYKASLNGKEFDPRKLGIQNYFNELGLDPGILGISYPTLNVYLTYNSGNSKPRTTKQAIQYYQTG